MEDDNEPIIMDIGTAYLKVGFANDDNPKHYIPMLVGEPKAPGIMVGMDEKKFYFGEEVLHKTKKPNLNISYPVQEGLVKEPELLSNLMDDVF
jgi:actin-related protein